MNWNGRKIRPIGNVITKKDFDFEDALKPLGEKKNNGFVWVPVGQFGGVQSTSSIPVTPTPTPSVTPTSTLTPTPSVTQTQTGTPSVTPTLTNTGTPTQTPTNTSTSSPTPSITPTNTLTQTNTNTPSETPTLTPTNTPTNSLTPTNTPTLSSTPIPPDSGATLYLSAVTFNGGTLDATLSAATNTLFTSLKSANIYNKLYAMYPILGGVANSHRLNALNPIDSNTAFRMRFNGTITHTVSGMTGNGTNGYAETFYTLNFVNNYSLGVYINATGTTQGIIMGCNNASGLKTQIQLDSVNNRYSQGVNISSSSTPFVTLTGRTGFYAMSKTGISTNNIYHQNGVSITGTTTTTSKLNDGAMALLANNTAGSSINNYSNDRVAFAYISSGLTISELTTLNNIIQTFQTSCSRNV